MKASLGRIIGKNVSNTVTNHRQWNILVVRVSLSIHHNYIASAGAGYSGISCRSFVVANVNNNTFWDNGGAVDYLYYSKGVVRDNIIDNRFSYNPRPSGIKVGVDYGGCNVDVINNTILSCYAWGVYYERAIGLVTNNTIRFSFHPNPLYASGITCWEGAYPNIVRNVITDSGCGIYVKAGAYPTISNNTLLRNGMYGIRADTFGGAIITGNIINDNEVGVGLETQNEEIYPKHITGGANSYAVICCSANNFYYPNGTPFDADGFPAQALQAYYTLRQVGYDDEHITFMLYHLNEDGTSDEFIDIDGDGVDDLDGIDTDGDGEDDLFPEINYENDQVTKEKLQWVLQNIYSGLTPDDNLLIYLVNHGGPYRFYFESEMSEPYVSAKEFSDWLKDFKCSMTVLVDACLSETFINTLYKLEPDGRKGVYVSATSKSNVGWFWTEADASQDNWFAGSWFFHPFWDQIKLGASIEDAYLSGCNFIPDPLGGITTLLEGKTVRLIQAPQLVPNFPVKIINNEIAGNVIGIYATDSTCTIEGNVIRDHAHNRVATVVGSVTFYESYGYGIYCDDSTVSIEYNNTIEHNLHGIVCINSTLGVANNILRNQNDRYLWFRAPDPFTGKLKTYYTWLGWGASCYNVSMDLSGNEFITNRRDATIDYSTGAIEINDIHGTVPPIGLDYGLLPRGIDYCNSTLYIATNTISDRNHGIHALSSTGTTIYNNTISQTGVGIWCRDASPFIIGNNIFNNWEGIRLYQNSNVTISFNIITSNTANGIYSWGSDIMIDNNTITFNGNGIYFYESLGTLENNIITNNTIGIYCQLSFLTMHDNIVSPNGIWDLYEIEYSYIYSVNDVIITIHVDETSTLDKY